MVPYFVLYNIPYLTINNMHTIFLKTPYLLYLFSCQHKFFLSSGCMGSIVKISTYTADIWFEFQNRNSSILEETVAC
ncbi:hypothetical protein XELAEV_18000040mg [Xenopus laevis]|uniref:Uncharacterized protein n=1 Tax=Xenopus laevis TaxID=8355 RepID=A0A974BQW0_XENLA|nr:hypothetical protein XELAEV_18000040mg [Xenopus laevis]